MAIGFGRKKVAAAAPLSSTAPAAEFGDQNYYNGFSPVDDVESAGQPGAPRKMSRIDRPMTKSISAGGEKGLTADDASDPSVSVGRQMELEAGNAIQYRTCSWQKVWLPHCLRGGSLQIPYSRVLVICKHPWNRSSLDEQI